MLALGVQHRQLGPVLVQPRLAGRVLVASPLVRVVLRAVWPVRQAACLKAPVLRLLLWARVCAVSVIWGIDRSNFLTIPSVCQVGMPVRLIGRRGRDDG